MDARRGLLILTAVGLAGCGSGAGGGRSAGPGLFTQDCAGCHSLSGHPTRKQQGGDLLSLHISRATMTEFVAEMPVRHPLSPSQLRAVVDYVQAVESRGR